MTLKFYTNKSCFAKSSFNSLGKSTNNSYTYIEFCQKKQDFFFEKKWHYSIFGWQLFLDSLFIKSIDIGNKHQSPLIFSLYFYFHLFQSFNNMKYRWSGTTFLSDKIGSIWVAVKQNTTLQSSKLINKSGCDDCKKKLSHFHEIAWGVTFHFQNKMFCGRSGTYPWSKWD